jgi:hypothetical protein
VGALALTQLRPNLVGVENKLREMVLEPLDTGAVGPSLQWIINASTRGYLLNSALRHKFV